MRHLRCHLNQAQAMTSSACRYTTGYERGFPCSGFGSRRAVTRSGPKHWTRFTSADRFLGRRVKVNKRSLSVSYLRTSTRTRPGSATLNRCDI